MVPETSQVQEDITRSEEPAKQDFKVTTAEMEAARRAQWKGAIEQELQSLVQEASDIRQKINTAKTQYKKTFYTKKFTKTQAKVMQMVSALQRLQYQEAQQAAAQKAAQPQQEEHVHDENCQHDHTE